MTDILSPYSNNKIKRGRGKNSPSLPIKYLIFLLILPLLLIQFTLGYNLLDNNLSVYFNAYSNFLDLENSFPFSLNIFDTSIFNKTFYFLFTNGKLEFPTKNWKLTGFYYSEYTFEINDSTLNLLKKIINKNSISVGESYNILANLEGYSVFGGMLSKKINLERLDILLNFKVLYGIDLQKGKLSGIFSRLDEESYQFNLNLEYSYNKNLLYKRNDLILGRGFGLSFDLDIFLKLNPRLLITISLIDLYGIIFWKDIPFTEATANSNREYYDEYGNIVFQPLISGYEGYRDFKMSIPQKEIFSLSYLNYPFIINLSFRIIKSFYLYELETVFLLSKDNFPLILKHPNNISWRDYIDSIRFVIFGDQNNSLNFLLSLSQKL